ncbi:FkbM family methyltransferase [Phenylobacterium sp.]|uniref:FkbM family methyltransferase n=1 Tax=Phenylobacterium sp. TaxID=1871053 RepID=UPI0037CBAA01
MARLSYAEALDLMAMLRDHARPDSPDEQMRFIAFCLRHLSESSAQLLQDLWVAYETAEQRGGYFVEFGAVDGVHASNTLYLERHLGWTGILAEPARIAHAALKANRACAIDTRCVWSESGRKLLFNQTVPLVHSTIDSFSAGDMHAASREGGERYEVETVSLNDLLAQWEAPTRIDYLSVDTEGSELDILAAFDFDRWDVRLISVEHNFTTAREALLDLLASKGYERRFPALSRVDDWYVKG